jgi:uncharacterized damage-inducible protein DinB
MTTSELLLQDFDPEMRSTRRILERIPDDKPDFKPHEKSMAMGRLAMHVATLPFFCKTILTTTSFDMANPSQQRPDLTFRTTEILVATFDAHAAAARAALVAATDEELAANWKFSFGEHVIFDGPHSLAYRLMFFNHMMHHRSQLGVYLRLNDIPVPGTYGPSADEPFAPKK